MEIITGIERRRRWRLEEKFGIGAELIPGRLVVERERPLPTRRVQVERPAPVTGTVHRDGRIPRLDHLPEVHGQSAMARVRSGCTSVKRATSSITVGVSGAANAASIAAASRKATVADRDRAACRRRRKEGGGALQAVGLPRPHHERQMMSDIVVTVETRPRRALVGDVDDCKGVLLSHGVLLWFGLRSRHRWCASRP